MKTYFLLFVTIRLRSSTAFLSIWFWSGALIRSATTTGVEKLIQRKYTAVPTITNGHLKNGFTFVVADVPSPSSRRSILLLHYMIFLSTWEEKKPSTVLYLYAWHHSTPGRTRTIQFSGDSSWKEHMDNQAWKTTLLNWRTWTKSQFVQSVLTVVIISVQGFNVHNVCNEKMWRRFCLRWKWLRIPPFCDAQTINDPFRAAYIVTSSASPFVSS